MRHFAAQRLAHVALYATVAHFVLACGADTDRSPPIGAPMGPTGPIISEAGSTGSSRAGQGGGAASGGDPTTPPEGGAFNSAGGGGPFGTGGNANDDPFGVGGTGSSDPFGVGGSPSAFPGTGGL